MKRRVLAALAVLGALAGCADLFGFKQLGMADGGGPDVVVPDASDAGDDGAADAGDAADEPDAATCTPYVWPNPPPKGQGGSPGSYTLAMRYVHFTTDADGGTATFGYDIDQACTTNKATASCTASSVVVDGPGGVDNSSITLLNGLINFQQPAKDSLSDIALDNDIDEGDFTMLIRLYGLKNAVDQTPTEGLTLALQSSPGIASGIPAWDGTDVWQVSASDVVGGLDGGSNAPINSFTGAYVSNGTLVATNPGPVTFIITLPPGNTLTGVLQVRLSQVVLTAKLVQRDGGAQYDMTDGILAGRWATTDALENIASLELSGGPLCQTLSGGVYDAVVKQLCPERDVASNGVDDGTSACDALSVAMSFQAVAADVANKPSPTPASSTPCFDAGQCN